MHILRERLKVWGGVVLESAALAARDSSWGIVVLWDEDLGIIGSEGDGVSISCHLHVMMTSPCGFCCLLDS